MTLMSLVISAASLLLSLTVRMADFIRVRHIGHDAALAWSMHLTP